ALVLDLDVAAERLRRAEDVDLHRMVDHQIDRLQRVDALRVTAEPLHGVAHGGEVDDAGDAREVLEDDARGHERYLAIGLPRRAPAEHRLDVLARHRASVLAAEQVLEQHPERERQPLDAAGEGVEPVHRVAHATHLERAARAELVPIRRHVKTLYTGDARATRRVCTPPRRSGIARARAA